ncbi:LPD38 domain-containing protein [Hoylesella shahii]|uniref:LPD38 domain-containing protein n=1 Tax=Hoylesella shahii TaxID=228603 RepID=UPI0028E5670C|nr:LPD38 domain-containing protein [Hoylesella shahii]
MTKKTTAIYNALSANGDFKGSEQDFNKKFFAPGTAGYEYRKGVFNTLQQGGADVGNSYEEFGQRLGLHAVKKAQPTQPKPTTASTPMTEAEKRAMVGRAADVVAQSQQDLAQTKRAIAHAKRHTGLDVRTPKLGQNRNVDKVNGSVSGQPQYETEDGQVYDNEAYATQAQNEYDQAKQYAGESELDRELREARQQQADLEDALRKRREELDNGGKGFFGKMLESAAQATRPDVAMHHNNVADYEQDEEYGQLMAAVRQNRGAIQVLEDKKNNKMNSFWHSFATTAANGYTFGDGRAELNDAIALTNAQKRLAQINAKRERGEMLTREEESAEQVLMATLRNQAMQGKYGDDYGMWARAGAGAPVSLDMMKSMLLGGGIFQDVSKGVAKGIAKAGLKQVAKASTKGLLKGATRTAAKGLVKATGVTLGSLAGGAIVSNTTGLTKTLGEAAKDATGNVGLDKQGHFQFENQKGLMSALAEAERSQIGENASEMFGEFLPDIGIGKLAIRGLEKIGLSKMAGFLTSMGGKQWAKQYAQVLRASGFNGMPNEALEEYAGILYNQLTGDSDNGLKTLADVRTHRDIWLGTATVGALMGAPNVVMAGAGAAQYYRYKHAMERAANIAQFRLTEDKWKPLQEAIDNTPNERLTDLMMDVYGREDMEAQEKRAVYDYVHNLVKYRGYNVGTINFNDSRKQENDPKQNADMAIESAADAAYTDGYNAQGSDMARAKREYDSATKYIVEVLGSDVVDALSEEPVLTLKKLHNDGMLQDDAVRDAVTDFVNAKMRFDGVVQRAKDDLDGLITDANNAIEQRTHQDGAIHPIILKEDEKRVYVVDGNISMAEDGEAVDTQNSDETLIVRGEDGTLEFISANDVANVLDLVDPQEERDLSEQTITHEFGTRRAAEIDGVDENGQPIPLGEEEQQEQTTPTELPTPLGNERVQEAGVQQQEQTAPTEQEQEKEQEEQEIEPMPMVKNKDGDEEPDFASATPQRAHQYIYNEAELPREVADEFVKNNAKAAQSHLDKVKKKQPKMGTSIAKYKAEQAAYAQEVQAAEQAVQYWNDVKATQDAIDKQQREEMLARQAEQTAEAKKVEEARQAQELAKREEQAKRGAGAAHQSIRERWENAPKQIGAADELTLPNGEKVKGHYVLVESGAATPSHDVSNEFAKTEGYPVDENGHSVNDRDYERDKDAQAVTRNIADNYDARALQSPVVVSPEGVVLSGNGRTMAGELAAINGTDGAYLETLAQYPHKYGFTTEQVREMQHPRVVFMADEAMPYTAETFAKFNQQEMKGQSKTEQSVKLGKVVSDEVFNRIIRGINGYDTLAEFYADTKAAHEALLELQDAGIITQAQMAELIDGDGISAQGRELLENVLIGKAFEGNPDAIRQLAEYKGMRQSVITALAEIANNKALGEAYELGTEIAAAISLAYQARKAGFKAGEKVSSYARQMNLFAFDDGDTVADYTNATMLMLADVLNDNRTSALKKLLAVYNHRAVDQANGQLDLFSGGIKDKATIINEVKQLIYNGTEQEQQAAIGKAVDARRESVQQNGTSERGTKRSEPNQGQRVESNEATEHAAEEAPKGKKKSEPRKTRPKNEKTNETLLDERPTDKETTETKEQTRTGANDGKTSNAVLSQKDYVQKRLSENLANTPYKTLEEWEKADIEGYSEQYDNMIAEYPSYLRELAKSEKLQEIYDRSSVKEQKKIREHLEDADIDYKEVLNTSPQRTRIQDRITEDIKYAKGVFSDGTTVSGKVVGQTPESITIEQNSRRYVVKAKDILEHSDKPFDKHNERNKTEELDGTTVSNKVVGEPDGNITTVKNDKTGNVNKKKLPTTIFNPFLSEDNYAEQRLLEMLPNTPYKSLFDWELLDEDSFSELYDKMVLEYNKLLKKWKRLTDKELLDEIAKSDSKQWNIYVKEYDIRHNNEYQEEVNSRKQSLEDENVSLDASYTLYMGLAKRWADGGYSKAERTSLRAQLHALEDYISRKEHNKLPNTNRTAYRQAQETVREVGYNLTDLRLRPLEKGEICHVERRYTESNAFSFTGKEHIESIDDVAYIFKQLETSSVENSFVVLIKDGKPTVIHLAIGSYSATLAPIEQAIVAVEAINPDKVVFVHNHPSGKLIASKQDMEIQLRFREVFGDKTMPAIIINTTSGKFGTFSETGNKDERIIPNSDEQDNIPINVYQFNKQVFDKNWNPETAFMGLTQEHIAVYISSHRLGEHKKMSLLVLDQAMHITGNVFLPWTKLTDINSKNNIMQIISYVNQMGGRAAILYGNYELGEDTTETNIVISNIKTALSNNNLHLTDVINIDDSASFRGVMEDEVAYVKRKSIDKPEFQVGEDVSSSTTDEQKLATNAVLSLLEDAGIPIEVVSEERAVEVIGEDAEMMSGNSERRKKREEKNRLIDEATALITGKDVKQVRKERIEDERHRKEEAQEIYEKVLSGDFSDVTLQKIDKYINEVTSNNVYGRRLSQRLPQGVERKMYQRRQGALGFDAIERDALFSRICESAVPKNGRASKAGRREVERRKEKALKGWAIATGHWHTDLSEFTDEQMPFALGTDSEVFLSKDEKHVIKLSKGKFDAKFPTDVDAVPLFNSVFPNSAYRIIGYGEIGGHFVKILEQPFVDFSKATPLSVEERVAYMESLGFKSINDDNTVFSNGQIIVADLQKSNIVKDVSGNIRVIDADVKLHTKDFGGNYTYPSVEQDLPHTEMKTLQGTIYGWTVGGKIYLTKDGLNPETPIHEYTHIWAEAMRRKNADGWNSVKQLLKDTSVWSEVLNDPNYQDIRDNEDSVASEVLSRISGKENAKKFEEQAKKTLAETRGIEEKAQVSHLISNIHRALNKFWNWVGKDLFGIKKFSSVEEVTDRVLYDLVNGTDLGEVKSDDVQFHKGKSEDDTKTLMGVHNITEDKLLKAIKMGGLANPSAAIIDTSKSIHNDYGEISLIMPSDMIDKRTGKNAVTFDGDAWTPMYPTIERQASTQGLKVMNDDINSVPKEMRNGVRNAVNAWMDGGSPLDLAYLYLFQKGKASQVLTEQRFDSDVHKSLDNIMDGKDSAYDLTKDDVKELVNLYVQVNYAGNINEFEQKNENQKAKSKAVLESVNPNSFAYKIAKANLEDIERYGYAMSPLNRFVNDVQRDKMTHGVVDVNATLNSANDIIKKEKLEDDFNEWLESLDNRYQIKEVIFDGFTPLGNRRYVPNTLENVSKLMKRQGRQASVGMSISFPTFAASVMKSNNTLANIKKKKGKLTSNHQDIEDFENKWKDVYLELGEKLQSNASAFDYYGLSRLQEAATKKNPQAFLKDEYGVTLSDEDAQKLRDLVKAIREERPAMYFETKFERPVMLEEFAAAVIPSNLSKKARAALQDAGLVTYEYEPGNEEDRKRAVDEAKQGDGVLFRDWDNSGPVERSREMYIEDKVQEMRTAVTDAAAKMNLVNVEVITSADELTEQKKRAKGWFDTKTKKITIVLSNHTSVEDAIKTLMHEAVAHYGLRMLFGDNFDTFLDNVYKTVPNDIARKIVQLAIRNKWNIRTATEEYLASLAEETDFENAKTKGWLQKIKDFFIKMLDATIGRKTNIEISEDELRYILWRSYQNLKGRDQGIGGHARDVVKRDELLGNTQTAKQPNILYRKAEEEKVEFEKVLVRGRYEHRMQSGGVQHIEAMQDSMKSLLELYKAVDEAENVKREVEDIPDNENAYVGENRLSSVNQADLDDFNRRCFKPLLNSIGALARTEEERQELYDYMMAKHGLERNKVMATREAEKEFKEKETAAAGGVGKAPNMDEILEKYRKRDYSGLTTLMRGDEAEIDTATAEQRAKEFVEKYEEKKNALAIQNLWLDTRGVNENVLLKMYRGGLLSKEAYNEISSMYQYYIPLRGFDEKTSGEEYAYLMGKNSSFSAPIRTAKGRTSKADNPIAQMALMADSAIMQANRNRLVKIPFLNYVTKHPSDLVSISDMWLEYDEVNGVWKPKFPDIDPNDKPELVDIKVEEFEKKMQELAEKEPDKYVRQADKPNIPYRVLGTDLREHQIIVKRNGKDYVLTINGNPRAAQAINGLTNPDNKSTGAIDKVFDWIAQANRWLSAAYTTRNPDFVISNFIRDTFYANTIIHVKESGNYAIKFHINHAKCNPVTIGKLLRKFNDGTLDMSDELQRYFYEFITNGGETGWTSVKNAEQHKSDIKKTLDKGKGRKAVEAIFENLDFLNRSIENSARFAAFVTSRQMGRQLGRSIYDAKEISVNFNKKGSGSKMLGATGQTWLGNTSAFVSGLGRGLYTFWNASVQGLTNYMRYTKRNPQKGAVLATTMLALGVLIPYVGYLLSGGDEPEGGEGYYDIPEYTRRSNILIRAGKGWIKIALPQEFRAVYGLGELAMTAMQGQDLMTRTETMWAAAEQLTQVLPINFLEGGGSMTAFVPTALKPIVEASINKSWTGLPIYNETPFNTDDPEWTKAFSSVGSEVKGITKFLSDITDGDDYTPGAINLNPAQIEYIAKGMLGGLYSFPDKIIKTAKMAFGDQPVEAKDMPFVNRLYVYGDERTKERAINNAFFKYTKEYEQTKKLIRNYEDEADRGSLRYAEKLDLMYNKPEYARFLIYQEYEKEINHLKKERKEAQGDPEETAYIEKEISDLRDELVHELREVK